MKLNQTSKAFKQILESMENDLKIWHEMDQVKLEILCETTMIPTRERYIEFDELMINKSLVVKELIKDVEAALEMSTKVEQNIISSLEKMSCKVVSQDENYFLKI